MNDIIIVLIMFLFLGYSTICYGMRKKISKNKYKIDYTNN